MRATTIEELEEDFDQHTFRTLRNWQSMYNYARFLPEFCVLLGQ